MTTTLLDKVPVESITEQAKQVRFWRSVLSLVAGCLFGLGWAAFKFFAVLWFGLAWSGCAVREGWREGRRAAKAASIPR